MTISQVARRVFEYFAPRQESFGGNELGTVGWGDGKDHYELRPGEMTLVKVTLYRGYAPGRDPKPEEGRAGGTKIMCRVSRPLNFIPEDKSEVLVALPAGFEMTPGAGFIIAVSAMAPENQHDATKAKLDFGPEVKLVIKAKSILLCDYQNRYIALGPDAGIKFAAGTNSAGTAVDASGGQLKNGLWQFYTSDADGRVVAGLQVSQSNGTKLFNTASDGSQSSLALSGGNWIGLVSKAWCNVYQVGILGDPTGPPGTMIPVHAGPSPGPGVPSVCTLVAVAPT
jgi:hypothetical protein